ncbi:MAG: hypothetical protein LBS69_07350 [Prevotellaceae bacterium]|jgi:hypothetical protein|nr:hypothetical protein [Prevotellaceae bacterium]
MKKKLKFMANMLLVAAIAAVAASCSKDDPAPVKKQPNIYVAGYRYDGNRNIAVLWKNGTATSLTNGAKNAWANSVFVLGGDVYVAGCEYSGDTPVAKIWKNGVLFQTLDGNNANSIFVK